MRRIILALTLIFASVYFSFPSVRPQAQQQLDNAGAIVLSLNQWRVTSGVPPLKPNPTLERMALDHAGYLLTLAEVPGGSAIHVGRSGDSPAQRARTVYGWHDYGDASRTAISEIAYVGANPAAAMRFWEGSEIHRAAALSDAYREIGVAALPHRFGAVYIVVLGSRPNVLPALVDEGNRRLYLTNERYRYANLLQNAIRNVTRVRLFDADGRAISGWQAWQAVIDLPASAGAQMIVEYNDGELSSLALVPINEAILATLPTATPTNPPTLTPLPTLTPRNELPALVSTQPVIATAQPMPDLTSPLAIPAVVSAQAANVAVIYDNQMLVVQNIGTQRLNLRDLIFVTENMSFSIHRWQTQWMNGTLDDFPATDCLHAWSWLEPAALEMPPICRQRRSVIMLPPEQMFWRSDFNIYWHTAQEVVANCRANAGRCEFFINAAR